MHIIIKNNTRKSFHPHFNHATGRYYGTREEYLSDLKRRGLEPADPKNVQKRQQKKYTPSKWARDIIRSVQSSGHISGTVLQELRKAQVKKIPNDLMKKIREKTPKGGWF